MTIISLRDLTLSAGEAKELTTKVELEPYTQSGVEYAPESTVVDAQLTVNAMLDGTAFRLRFTPRFEGPCARCLEPAVFAPEIDVYQLHDPRAVPVDEDDDLDELRSDFVDDDKRELDLSGWAQEEVGLRFPTRVLCQPDCAGLPTSWGDTGAEDEVTTADGTPIDPRWAALKALEDKY